MCSIYYLYYLCIYILYICYLCSIKLNVAGVNTFYMQAKRDSQTNTSSRPGAFRGMWEWERVWKITQPKYDVVTSSLFPSSAPNGYICWLHYCLNRNCINSELWRKIPAFRKNEIITNHSPRSQKKKNGHEKRPSSSTIRHFQSDSGIYFSLDILLSELMNWRCIGQDPPGKLSSPITVLGCIFFKSLSGYSLY